MNKRYSLPLAALLLLAGCRQGVAPAPEYRPEEAGTVDHAMCLLGFTAVPVREVVTGHHLIEATINGRSGRFVLDTGANATVLDEAHRQHFGVGANLPGFGGAIGIGGGGRANQVRIGDMRIGPVDVRRNRIVAADLGQLLQVLGRVTGGTVYGIIGQDVLKEHRAIIDVSRPMLYLMAEDRDPSPVPSERCSRIDGERAPAESSGAPS